MRIIIIGAGQVGSAITGAMASERADVVAVDLDEESLVQLRDIHDIQTVCGSGANPQVLDQAGIASADMVVAVTDSDEVNMVASAIANMRSPHAIKVARIREKAFVQEPEILEKGVFGVDHAINPELVAADRIIDILDVPFASDVADCGPGLKLVGVRLLNDSPLEGISFAGLREMAPDLKVLAANRVRRGETIVPRGTDDLRSKDTLYLVARTEDLKEVANLFKRTWRPAKRITIAGGTGIGAILAARLDAMGKRQVKLIEADHHRALQLAEELNKVLVLQGSSTDESLLLEENIRDCDVFIAALQEEEANVMAALNAKRLGAHRVIALTNKLAYVPIIEEAGIDAVVSPRALAIGTMLHHARKGKVKAVIPFGDSGQAEAIEFEALDTSDAVGKPLKSLRFPDGAIVGALLRNGEPIIPGGDDVIQPGDDVFVFATKRAIPKIEKMMAVKLDFF